ncbi:hypothetical protein [Azospirillum brasilense]|uniref:hypothetical protein n=1 Tax=Azospirillum brasilense TaxID=192 RepID=UPI00157A56B0|nr:hypothetical protein [Azospirillum brasilense]NUB25517.1 hypothetical protein [Azospirillum brasilense]NUB31524.1 hypothetical protein [Azospirillum brasilense]UKJ78188.1 hypothetical protein H1Q64_33295 [Azospirillum brasilense]
MIDRELLGRYQTVFGCTFDVALWTRRPGDGVNDMMRAALAGYGPPVTDERIASRVRERFVFPDVP